MDVEKELRDLRRKIDALEPRNRKSKFQGVIDMKGGRVINAAASKARNDYVTKHEMGQYVTGLGVAFETFAGSGTSYTLSSKAANVNAIAAFINGIAGENGGSGANDYALGVDRETITTNTSLTASDFLMVIYMQEET